MKQARLSLIVALLVVTLYGSHRATACGPFFRTMIMSLTKRPDAPPERFAQGELGVIQPTYWRIYLVPAYRQLVGSSFDQDETTALLTVWGADGRPTHAQPSGDPKEHWLTGARLAVGLPAALEPIDQYRWVSGPGLYGQYLNCPDDALRTAARTLAERSRKYGNGSPAVKEWVEAQDRVFANCGGGPPAIPAEPTSADALAVADRQYQIAAAHLYAEDFEVARARFDAIAQDADSPWSTIAPYLAARALVRKGTLGADHGQVIEAPLAEAERRLNAILADSRRSEIHPACERLLDFIRYRLRPDEELKILEARLLKTGSAGDLVPGLLDYTNLLMRHEPEHPGELADWVLNVRAMGSQVVDHAVARWKDTSSEAWLVAALMKLPADHPQRPALSEAAEKVRPESPAFVSASYHRLRLEVESGEEERARNDLDDFLAEHRARLTVSPRNLFLDLRLKLARDLAEFVRFAQREPAGVTFEEDGESTWQFPPVANEGEVPNRRTLSRIAADTLNRGMPLDLLVRTVTTADLAPNVQSDLAQAVWARAVLLDRIDVAVRVDTVLARHIPALKTQLAAADSAKDAAGQKFAQVFLLLRTPGLRPYVSSAYRRGTPVGELDPLRENWWCAPRPGMAADTPMFVLRNVGVPAGAAEGNGDPGEAQVSFVTMKEREAAREEWRQLASAGTGPNFLAQQVLAFAAKHPDDPRVPEALHRVVRATRFGCTDSETSQYSKSAFQFLHAHYPESEWTRKTRYWY